jgi:hypothetical protein
MKHLALMLLTLTLINAYWLDGDGDHTKSVLILEYSDGTNDHIVVDKKELAHANVSNLETKIHKVLDQKGASYGN